MADNAHPSLQHRGCAPTCQDLCHRESCRRAVLSKWAAAAPPNVYRGPALNLESDFDNKGLVKTYIANTTSHSQLQYRACTVSLVSKSPAPLATELPKPPGAQQKRSLRTEELLLAAASHVLDRDGLDGATVPRIAAEAKLSPASIYRRFADKDDLLRATFLRILEAGNAQNAQQLQATPVRGKLADTAEALVTTLLKQYREHPQRLRAMNRMIEAAPQSPFAKEALARIAANSNHAAEVLLAHRESIRHQDPVRAARFAVLSATGAIELAVLDQTSLWRVALPLSDKAFAAELSRQMVAYLRRKR